MQQTTHDRDSLSEKLNKDLEKFIEQKILESQKNPRNYNFDNKTVDEIAEEMKQHPAFMTEFDESKPMSTAMEALQVLKYESQSNDDNATSYKEDGNVNFQRKKYRWAIDNYTAGLNCKPMDCSLIAVLYTNRAAAHYHIGNYRSSINDCMSALKSVKGHKKAWLRIIDCYTKLEKYPDVIEWCDKALELFPDETKVQQTRLKAEQKLKEIERNKRKEKIVDKKLKAENFKLIQAIKHRKISLYKKVENEANQISLNKTEDNNNDNDWLEIINQSHNGGVVKMNSDANTNGDLSNIELMWPVLFLYPEYGQSDFIMAFNENSMFKDHLNAIFESPAPWDVDEKYKPQLINIYFEEFISGHNIKLHKVEHKSSLLTVLQNNKCKLTSSLVTFILLVKNSEYEKTFLKNYT